MNIDRDFGDEHSAREQSDGVEEDFWYEENMNEENYWLSLFDTCPPQND